MFTTYQGEKTDEAKFVNEVRSFLSTHGYIRDEECHFDGDDVFRADVELALVSPLWPADMPGTLYLEAKSHHSTDSPNTINKAFGQLLKEANKNPSTRGQRKHCLGLLIPIDGAIWIGNKGKTERRGCGIEYYRQGFRRIDPTIFSGFGDLVKARYILGFSVHHQYLDVYNWDDFHAGHPYLVRLLSR